jgi:tetratricopeptide (TPR) repeat protein
MGMHDYERIAEEHAQRAGRRPGGSRAQPGPAALLRLQRAAGNAATGRIVLARRKTDDDETEEELDVTPESIRTALAGVSVTTTEQRITGLMPWEIFKHATGNTQDKKKLYNALKSALRDAEKSRTALESAKQALGSAPAKLAPAKLAKLQQAVPKAEKAHEKAVKRAALARTKLKEFIKGKIWRWSPDPKLAELEREVADKKKALARLNKARKKDAAAIKAAQAALDDARRRYNARLEELKQEVENDPMEMGTFTRTRYTIRVGDTTVNLHDHVEAYATIAERGLEGSAHRTATAQSQTVDQLVDADPTISSSTKKIIKLVSSFEGRFSSVNTWDIADVTWGFIQWTTGKSGKGSLIDTLLACKAQAPKVFDQRLRRFGIDVSKADGLVVTLPDGTVKKGKDAARHIQVDPLLTAILSASGEDPEFKIAQLRHANDKVGKEVLRARITVDGRKVKLGDVLTSELAVGGAFNRAVHAGAGAVQKLLSGALNAWAKKEKIDTGKPVSEWGAEADAVCIAALRGVETDRMRTMAATLSAEPGSFR